MAAGGSTHHGNPGASARREHFQRKRLQEARMRQRHSKLGGLLLAVPDEPQHESAWERGAQGEELVAGALVKRCRPDVHVFHDLAMPGSRANIDHIAVAPTGVWVIDAKRYKGKVEVRKPLLGHPTLRVAGRDQSALVAALHHQVEVTRAAVSHGIPVRGAFCFVDAEMPLLGLPAVEGLRVLTRRGLVKRLNAKGPLTSVGTHGVARVIAREFTFA